jgi:hypothetical protein
MAQQAILQAFRALVEPELKARAFRGRRGHLCRELGGVTQIVELQHSIYGGRVTANLGLNLDFLKPLVRWITAPTIGPHAHDSTRWIRIGLVRPEHVDCWWTFEAQKEDAAAEAALGLGRAVLDHGLPWLDRETTPGAFLGYANARLERSRTIERPHGSYLDLRLLAAVLAWNGEIAQARVVAERAAMSWQEERLRLVQARAEYRRKNPRNARRVPSVPDIQAELDQLISTTLVG